MIGSQVVHGSLLGCSSMHATSREQMCICDPIELYHHYIPINPYIAPLLSCLIEADNLLVYSFQSAAAASAAGAAATIHNTDSHSPLATMCWRYTNDNEGVYCQAYILLCTNSFSLSPSQHKRICNGFHMHFVALIANTRINV